jgi:NADH-quinone oxidoreductase subunit N
LTTIHDILDPQNSAGLVHNTLDVSLPLFKPELILVGTIVLMLLVRVLNLRFINGFVLALAGSLAAFIFAAPWDLLAGDAPIASVELFTGLLRYDAFTVYFRALLMAFAVLFVLFTWCSGIPDREDSTDFFTLVFGATIGLCLMASANHLLTVFLAVEMASVPSYALAGMLKGRRESSEAALKYAVYGAGAAGVMLYGISLIAGVLGSAHLPTLAHQLAIVLSEPSYNDRHVVLALGGLMIMVGLAFKLSAVPFHFWCPDVFEGASAEVNAFLSVASKAGALALLIRVAVGFGHLPAAAVPVAQLPAAPTVMTVAYQHEAPPAVAPVESTKASDIDLRPARSFMAGLVALIAAVTCTFGNLTAYGQTNIKRLLAYSTIAHAGYMMMPVAALLLMLNEPGRAVEAQKAAGSIAFYVGAYLFMNLSAFAVVAFLRNSLHSEEISAYSGLIRRSPGVVICFATVLLSLLGLPPLAGFAAKFVAFSSLAEANQPLAWTLLFVGGMNTVFSLFYYLRVVKVMTLDPEPDDRAPAEFSLVSRDGAFVAFMTLPVILLGIWPDFLLRLATAATTGMLS